MVDCTEPHHRPPAVCQPLAMSPWNGPVAASSRSTWIAAGRRPSRSAMISSSAERRRTELEDRAGHVVLEVAVVDRGGKVARVVIAAGTPRRSLPGVDHGRSHGPAAGPADAGTQLRVRRRVSPGTQFVYTRAPLPFIGATDHETLSPSSSAWPHVARHWLGCSGAAPAARRGSRTGSSEGALLAGPLLSETDAASLLRSRRLHRPDWWRRWSAPRSTSRTSSSRRRTRTRTARPTTACGRSTASHLGEAGCASSASALYDGATNAKCAQARSSTSQGLDAWVRRTSSAQGRVRRLQAPHADRR